MELGHGVKVCLGNRGVKTSPGSPQGCIPKGKEIKCEQGLFECYCGVALQNIHFTVNSEYIEVWKDHQDYIYHVHGTVSFVSPQKRLRE